MLQQNYGHTHLNKPVSKSSKSTKSEIFLQEFFNKFDGQKPWLSNPSLSLHRARMPGEFDSRDDTPSIKFKQRPQTLVKICFGELCDSKLTGLCHFNNIAISFS